MKIRCRDCGHSETMNKELILTFLGGAAAGFGFWAWVSFLFAGTGFAMPLCIAIVVGGPALVAKYGDEIVEWLANKGYTCKKCNGNKWMPISEEADIELNRYKTEEAVLKNTLSEKELEIKEFLSEQNNLFSIEDLEHYFNELEQKDNTIENLLKDKEKWEVLKQSYTQTQEQVNQSFKRRFNVCYPSLIFNKRALKGIGRLNETALLKFEQKLGQLQHRSDQLVYRDKIQGTDIIEMDFNQSGRFYIQKEGASFHIVCVGDKKTQLDDLKFIKNFY
ncbi:hypothetical protein Q674_06300 [Acinetobacter sp. COS3]|uniref:hypothetical protein n=1 Tax=Acinetobacter sp. COS3 TaxID=1397525 RepID=UPI0003B88576|nr:hypothetical protein [Acinetobacter sp. COS3]ERP95050.1 hypothetical protein Q674_06300 [Acinetobacter sp. COS3]